MQITVKSEFSRESPRCIVHTVLVLLNQSELKLAHPQGIPRDDMMPVTSKLDQYDPFQQSLRICQDTHFLQFSSC